MSNKTNVKAEDNLQEITIERIFDLPVELLYKAYSEAEYIEQWMGTIVKKLEHKNHGNYLFETEYEGKVVFRANGTIHEVIPNKSIIRTFEMDNSGFPVQLEFIDFSEITNTTSKLTIKMVFKSISFRNELLKLPFANGLNMAHNRLQDIFNNQD